MSTPATSAIASLLNRLNDPVRIRIATTIVILLATYVCLYLPTQRRVQDAAAREKAQRQRHELARRVEHLRNQAAAFEHRIPGNADVNEWVEYVLGGMRSYPLKLVALEPDAPRSIGPYRAIVLRLQLEGSFQNLDAFLRWLESNERLIRVDDVQLSLLRGQQDVLVMQLTMLGVTS